MLDFNNVAENTQVVQVVSKVRVSLLDVWRSTSLPMDRWNWELPLLPCLLHHDYGPLFFFGKTSWRRLLDVRLHGI